MTRGQVAWDKKLPADRQEYLRSLVLDRDVAYADIAEEFNVDAKNSSQYATRSGIGRRQTGARKAAPAEASLAGVERQIKAAMAQALALKTTIAELQTKRAELQLRYESEGTEVLVYGIGAGHFRAEAADWLRWLNAEGARKLRDHITAHHGGAR